MSNFDEKAGVVSHATGFGKWYQTVAEVTIIIDLEPGTRGKEVQVTILPRKLKCVVRGRVIIEVSIKCRTLDCCTDIDKLLG